MDIRRRAILSETLYEGGSSEEPINTDNYLTIEAIEDGLTASLSTNACEYCINGNGNWKTLAAGTATESINSGHTLSFRGNLTPKSFKGIGTFTISKECNIKGNCMSMLFGDNAMNNYSLSGKDYAFQYLFRGCKTIIRVSESFLPATTLDYMGYYGMFYGCTSLTTAPELPATTLSTYCYQYMFSGCTSLAIAPELPATTLATYCYQYMFSGCTSLTSSPKLPATALYSYCYQYMFSGTNVLPDCSNIDFTSSTVINRGGLRGLFAGTKVTDNDLYNILPINPATGKYWLPATTLTNSCYNSMFNGCTSLTTAPELPATTLAESCYQQMFSGCTKLKYIKMLATDISASDCLNNWVSNIASTGTFVKNSAMNSLQTGVSGIPSGWTVVNDGEESGGNLITFTIDGTEYQAEEGMTWGEWVDSEYNVINASIYLLSSSVGYINMPIPSSGEQGGPYIIYDSNFVSVIITQEIIANHNYIVGGMGGGN